MNRDEDFLDQMIFLKSQNQGLPLKVNQHEAGVYLDVGCIVTACHAAVVVTQGIELIKLALGAVFIRHIIRQVKIVNRKVDESLQLVLIRSAVRESLQMDDQHLRKPPQI